MNLLARSPTLLHPLLRAVLLRLPLPPLRPPLFLLGCGRSGTTLLGQCLGAHPEVTYLNEPRLLWSSCFPETDIWSSNPERRRARLLLGSETVADRARRRLVRRFSLEMLFTGRPRLVEKTPANNFRIPFLLALFPEARFLYLERDGLDVAHSIAKQTNWYGEGHNYKWRQLRALAERRADMQEWPARCESPFHKGLLEWRLSCQMAREHLGTLIPVDRVRFLHYECFVADPCAALCAVFAWLGWPFHSAPLDFARKNVRSPTSGTLSLPILDAMATELAGPLLNVHRNDVHACQSKGIALFPPPGP